MKKPILFATLATTYIALIVSIVNFVGHIIIKDTILIPMVMLGLFVLSAAVMGFLFLSEPFRLYMENKKREALIFFGKIVGFFACFVIILSISLLFFIY